MKATRLVSAAVAASLGFSSVSFAQGWRDHGEHPGRQAHERRAERFEQRQERRAERFEHRQDRRMDRFEQHREAQRHGRDGVRGHGAPAYVYQAPPVQYTAPQRHWRDGHRGHGAPAYVYQAPPVQYTAPHASYGWRAAPYYAPRVHYVNTAPRYYYQGDVLPYEYRRHMPVVADWQQYGLYAPPYGHQWVRSDTGEILLIAIATGLIASLLLR